MNALAATTSHFFVTLNSGLSTSGGDTVQLLCSDANYQNCYFGPSGAALSVTMTSAQRGLFRPVACSPGQWHRCARTNRVLCSTQRWNDWIWSMNVCGQVCHAALCPERNRLDT